MKRGISVYCVVCKRRKAPIGRSVPYEIYGAYCERECAGYDIEPFVGSLWPGETEAEFGYPVGKDGTEEIA